MTTASTCPSCGQAISLEGLHFAWEQRRLRIGGRVGRLTRQQADLFAVLFERRGELVHRDRCLAKLQEPESADLVLKTLIHHLRRLLAPEIGIETRWREGYILHVRSSTA